MKVELSLAIACSRGPTRLHARGGELRRRRADDHEEGRASVPDRTLRACRTTSSLPGNCGTAIWRRRGHPAVEKAGASRVDRAGALILIFDAGGNLIDRGTVDPCAAPALHAIALRRAKNVWIVTTKSMSAQVIQRREDKIQRSSPRVRRGWHALQRRPHDWFRRHLVLAGRLNARRACEIDN